MDGPRGGNVPPPFLTKTYDMVDDPETDMIVSWSSDNNSFVVWNAPEFARDLLPKYFKHNNFSSFVRQLNTYGFRKVDPDRWEFANEIFLRGQRDLLKNIHRRKPSSSTHVHSQQQAQGSTPGYVEAAKFGVEGEIERLKREKNDLIMELMRLRQQQQATEQELQGLGQRIQSMQQRQKQMMTFLVKALQIPDFFAQHLQRNENSIQYGANKKRRLPKQEGEIGAEESQTSEGQLVKFQLGDNGRAHSMFMQLFNHEVSSKDDISASSLVSFVRELTQSSLELLDGNSSVSCSSGITLTEMQASTGLPDALASNFSGQSSLEHSSSPPSFSKLEKMGKTDVTDDLDVVEYLGSGTGNTDSMEVKAESMPLEKSVSEEGAPDNEAASTFVDGSAKVGGSNDGFWEQFLTEKPGSTDAEAEVEMKVPGNGVLEKQEQRPYPNSSWWSSKPNVDKLVDQMGQLVSAPKP